MVWFIFNEVIEISRNGSIRYQIEKELKSMCRFGESRHEAKLNNEAYKYIYSFNSLKTYIRQMNYMVNWAKENNIKLKSIDDIKAHGNEWLQWNIDKGYSPWTVMTRRAAICKLCKVNYSYFDVKIPKRERKIVTKSRDMSKSQKYYNEGKNISQIIFCRCTGLRLSELKEIRGTDLVYNEKNEPFLHITKGTKGGKPRTAQIVGSEEEISLVLSLIKKAGNEKIFKRINQHINTHGLRAEYCRRVYDLYARDISTLKHNEIVFCRKDKKGVRYDREALYIASKYLGHNRYSVTNINYLY